MKARRVREARVEAFILMGEWCLRGTWSTKRKKRARLDDVYPLPVSMLR